MKTAASAAQKGAYPSTVMVASTTAKISPGFAGNCYSSIVTGVIVDGAWVDCTRPYFCPYFEAGVSF
jgi:hypothetical protein